MENGQFKPLAPTQKLELPIHEIHAFYQDEKLEILLNEIDGATWTFRRNPSITYPLNQTLIIATNGIPILCPEVVLLYKAKGFLGKDYADLLVAIPYMETPKLSWLNQAILHTHGQDHPWLAIIMDHLIK